MHNKQFLSNQPSDVNAVLWSVDKVDRENGGKHVWAEITFTGWGATVTFDFSRSKKSTDPDQYDPFDALGDEDVEDKLNKFFDQLNTFRETVQDAWDDLLLDEPSD